MDLLAVLLGGILAIAGGVVSPIIQHRLQGKSKEKEAKRQHLHDLTQAVFEHQEFMRRHYLWSLIGGDEPNLVNPHARIHALMHADFSEQLDHYREFAFSSASYEVFAADRYAERQTKKPINNTGYDKVIEDYTLKCHRLLNAVYGQRLISKEMVEAVKFPNKAASSKK